MSFSRTRTDTRPRAHARARETFAQLGEHAGLAIYKPRDRRDEHPAKLWIPEQNLAFVAPATGLAPRNPLK
jgi:hypothetical protein